MKGVSLENTDPNTSLIENYLTQYDSLKQRLAIHHYQEILNDLHKKHTCSSKDSIPHRRSNIDSFWVQRNELTAQ